MALARVDTREPPRLIGRRTAFHWRTLLRMPADARDAEEARSVSEVMRAPLGEFTSRRSEVVRRLRTEGDRELAARIGKLRKPSVVVWALNQAGAVAAAELESVRAAGEQLRHAQERVLEGDRSAVDEMQRATQEQRRAVDILARRLGIVLTASGHSASGDTMRRVADALRTAATTDDQTWAAFQQGRLTTEPAPASLPVVDAKLVERATEQRVDREADTRRRRLDAAEAELRRAEEVERAAREQEATASERRKLATDAVEVARRALSELEKA